MKYAIQASYYMWNKETKEDYEEWLYLGLEGKSRIFVFDDDINERTKLFNTAKEAGEYIDKHFGSDKVRCSFSTVRMIEVDRR